jgi:hypothetical protein
MRVALTAARDSATTVTDREAATVLLAGEGAGVSTVRSPASEQPTALVGDRHTASATGIQTAAAETVTRVQSQAPRNSSAVWKGAIAAAVLLACAGGFYGYRLIKNRSAAAEPTTIAKPSEANANSNPNPQPANDPQVTAAEPGTNKTAGEAPVQRIIIKDPAKQSTARKTEQGQKETPETPPAPDPRTDSRSGGLFPNANVFQTVPARPVPNLRPERTERTPSGALVRTLPDGTQIVTQPDGTRIVRRPNGTTRIYGPGENPFRRPPRRRQP